MFAATIGGTKTPADTIPVSPTQDNPATPAPVSKARKIIPGIEYWRVRKQSVVREYAEVVAVVAAITTAGWYVPVSYHSFGHIYLLMVIALSVRVGRGPVLFAAVLSAVTWNYVFMPPRMSFSVVDFEDALTLGTYFFAALIGGQLTARIRAQERYERQREQRASALFHLTRALAAAQTLDEAVAAALRQADELFDAQTALLLLPEEGRLVPHPAGSLALDRGELSMAAWAVKKKAPTGRFTGDQSTTACLHLPLRQGDAVLGVFSVRLPLDIAQLTPTQQDLIDGFTAQIALLVEREQLRAASAREKLLAESDRLHRTLLDSVSHELKTPLAVLRSAGEKLDTPDEEKRQRLAGEIRVATRRLDHLVANLLDQTRLESGGLKPQLDWCDARDLISTARRVVGEALATRPVVVEVPPEMPLFLADAVLMEHVLSNLLLNAALHTPAPGAIRVTAGQEDQHVFIAVSDSGPGIPPELQGSLFQKFRRGDAARAGGLGLGLSIVRGFVLAQKGEVLVGKSREGGAFFSVRLPYSPHGGVPNDEH